MKDERATFPRRRYGIAVATVVIGMLFNLLLGPFLSFESPFVVLLGAVAVSAWYGGLGPGIVATAAAALTSAYFSFAPYYSFVIDDPGTRIRWLVFLLEGLLISGLSGALHAARARAEGSEAKVQADLAERQRLFVESEARRHRAESLAEIGRGLVQALDPAVVAQQIADSIRALLHVRSSAVYRVLPESGDLVALVSSGDVGPTFGRNLVFPRGTGVANLAVEERRPIITPDLFADPRITLTPEVRARIDRAGYRAVLAVPLVVQDRVIGALGIGDDAGRQFSDDEVALAQTFADQAAVALENARLFEEVQRERRRLAGLYDVSRQLVAVHGTEEVLAVIVHEAARLLGAGAAALRLRDGEDLVLRAQTESAAAMGASPRIKVGESLSGFCVAKGEPVAVDDITEDPRYDPVHKRQALAQGFLGFLAVPLRVEYETIGALYVYTAGRRRFSDDDVSLLAAFADQAALAIVKERLFSERARAEEALRRSEKLASLGQVLAGVAHELNNPLTVVVGYVQLLQRGLDTGSVAERIDRIAEATERCVHIVRNFLALARQEPLERKPVDLNQTVRAALDFFRYGLQLDQVEVGLRLADDLPILFADPEQMQQVAINLISNAHDALRSAPPPRRVTISSWFDARRRRACLAIADTGPGIPPEMRSRVFDPFFTTKPVGQGMGLGLSLCHGIVKSHGGSIDVEGTPGGGATVLVEIPVESLVEAPMPATDSSAAPLRSKTILVVDDEPEVAQLLADTLSLDGHRVDRAENGAVALDRLAARAYDVILSDVKMPVLDGPGLYTTLEERAPEVLRRFVFVTGDSLSPTTREFLRGTKAPVLVKPFNLDEVRRVIRDAVETASPT